MAPTTMKRPVPRLLNGEWTLALARKGDGRARGGDDDGVGPVRHRPRHTGSRFSAKAFGPSLASSDASMRL
jgi:hypothetical protein